MKIGKYFLFVDIGNILSNKYNNVLLSYVNELEGNISDGLYSFIRLNRN